MRRVSLTMTGIACLVGTVILGSASTAAAGGRNGGDTGASETQPGSYEVHTQVITIELPSGSTDVLTGTYTPPPPCFYRLWGDGPHVWDVSLDPHINRLLGMEGIPQDERWPADLEEHKDDTDGAYWYPMCSSAYWPDDDLGAFFDYVHEYFADHDTVWVPTGDAPPNPPVPPEVLVRYAQEYADAPRPVVEHNPGTQAVVRLDTWVWLTDSTFEPVEVTARSGPNWATLTLAPERMELSAPNATQVGSCASGGMPYDLARPAASQSTDCALLFSRSSAAQPGNLYEVTSTTSWSASWVGSDGSGGALEGATAVSTFDLEVAEVQTVVTGTR